MLLLRKENISGTGNSIVTVTSKILCYDFDEKLRILIV